MPCSYRRGHSTFVGTEVSNDFKLRAKDTKTILRNQALSPRSPPPRCSRILKWETVSPTIGPALFKEILNQREFRALAKFQPQKIVAIHAHIVY